MTAAAAAAAMQSQEHLWGASTMGGRDGWQPEYWQGGNIFDFVLLSVKFGSNRFFGGEFC
jgi:hypothetical protein